MRKLTAFICMMTMCLTPCGAFAAEAGDAGGDPQQPTAARSLDEFIELTTADLEDASFDVNKNNGRITGTEEDLTFREAFGTTFGSVRGNKGAMKETINETEGYQVTGETRDKIHVESAYGLKRILVNGVLDDSYGADSAVTYDGETLLMFDSTEDTRRAYEELTEICGAQNVLVDQIISIEEEPAAETLPETDMTGEVTVQEEEAPQTKTDPVPETDLQEETVPEELPETEDLAVTEEEPVAVTQDPNSDSSFVGWGTSFMGLDYELGQFENCDETITIAVLDTGVNENHEIFDDTTISEDSRGFISNESESDYTDRHGHGTKVSGIIAESTPSNVELLELKVLNDEGKGSVLRMLQALDYAAEHDARIVNMSFGFTYSDQDVATAYNGATMDRHFSDIASRDIVLFAASGNSGENMDKENYNFYPAESPYTVAVGAVNEKGKRWKNSNYGNNLDLVAPGTDLTLATAAGNSDYAIGSNGTSFSCPYISASAAYLLMDNEDHTPDTIRAQLKTITDPSVTGVSGFSALYGYGMPKYTESTVLTPVDLEGSPKVKTSVCEYDGTVKIPEITVTHEGDVMASYAVEPLTDCIDIGTQKIRITLRGNYTDTISVVKSFKIVPQRVELADTCTVYKSGQKMGFSWSASQGMSRMGSYQVQIATKKNFSKYKSYKASGQSATIGKLKAGKIYYVRVRACDKVGGKTYYSPWSTVKSYKNKY